jgi:hypothetical protein
VSSGRARSRGAQSRHGRAADTRSRARPGDRLVPLLVAGVAAYAAACASALPPPGGPERHAPPLILSFTPETNAVNVRAHEASIQFDEVVSQRPQGSSDLASLFLVSPRDGEPRVSWHRSRVTIRPHRDLRPNTVYTITMLPGMADLHNNVRRTGATLTFSTGPTIPMTIVRGRVFDWMTGQVAARAFVQAYSPTDTMTVYVTAADSTGAFAVPHLPPGTYIVRGIIDANHNHKLDRTEMWDTSRINLTDTARVELLAFLHDTLGPRISEVEVRDSVTLRVGFDRGFDTAQRITPSVFTLKARDSTEIPIAAARSAAAFDSAVDSAARVRRDSAFRVDSIRRAAAGRGPADTAAARRREEQAAHRRDSLARTRRPTPSRPSPVHDVVVQLGAPLHPGTYYRVQAIDVRGLLGKSRTSDRVFSMPKPTVSDSARARQRADSASRGRRARPVPGRPAPDQTPSGQAPSPSPAGNGSSPAAPGRSSGTDSSATQVPGVARPPATSPRL